MKTFGLSRCLLGLIVVNLLWLPSLAQVPGVFQSLLTAPNGGSITYTGYNSVTAALTTYNLTSTPFGTATSNRVIVAVCTGSNLSRSLSSATIGGIAANIVVSSLTTSETTAMISAVVPTGTTGTISITWSGGQAYTGCAVWAAYNLNSAVAITTASSSTTSPMSLNMNVITGDVIVVGGYVGSVVSFTPTGYTQNYSNNSLGGTTTQSGGSAAISTTASPRTISMAFTGAPGVRRAVAAVFR